MSRTLEKLIIKRFRGLRDVVLGGLGQVNIIVGPNNCGKSSVLEALELLSDPTNPWCWRVTGGRHRATAFPLWASEVDDIELLFPRSKRVNAPRAIAITTEGEHPVARLSASTQRVRGRRPAFPPFRAPSKGSPEEAPLVDTQGLKISLELASHRKTSGASIDGTEIFIWEQGIFEEHRRRKETNFEFVGPYAHVDPVQAYSLIRLGDESLDVRFLELMRDFDPHIASVEVLAPKTPRAELFLTDDRAGKLPLSAFGSGLRRAAHLALVVPFARNGILAIDEIDVSLHRNALTRVFRWLLEAAKEHNVQLFVTTHSLEAVDAMLAADTTPEEDIVAFRLDRSEGNKTEVRRYGEDLLKRLRFERGLDIR